MISTDVMQEVSLFNETFSPSEAKDIICTIIDKQINYYKLQSLSQWVGNKYADCYPTDEIVSKLTAKKEEIMEMFNDARINGRQVYLNGSIELAVE